MAKSMIERDATYMHREPKYSNKQRIIFVEKIQHNGHLVISDDKGHKMTYIGFSKRDAISRFKKEFK